MVHFVIAGAASLSVLIVALPFRGKTSAEAPVEAAVAADDAAAGDAAAGDAAAGADPQGSGESSPAAARLRESSASRAQLAAQRERRAQLVWRRDPFAPPFVPEVPEPVTPEITSPVTPEVESEPAPEVAVLPRPQLSGVSRRGETLWAIIDHEIVSVGDELPTGHRVVRIDPRSVALALGSESLVLTLGGAR